MNEQEPVYVAKCFWPGVSREDVERAAARAARQGRRRQIPAIYLGAICFPDDELVLCLYAASSRLAVQRSAERAGLPCERVMASVWMPSPPNPDPEGTRCPDI
jgi:uncharacterized protein DUF4242